MTVGAVGLTTRALAHAAPSVELTFQQWRALLILGEDPNGARVGEVASRVGVTLPATSRLLRRLERRGLAVLATDDADRRATRARLTEAGASVRRDILAYRRAALRGIADGIADADRRALEGVIDALAAGFEPFS